MASYSGSLARLCWGEGQCKQTQLRCVGSAHGGWTKGGLPQSKAVCRSKLLQDPGVLRGHGPRWAVHFLRQAGLRLWYSWQIWTIKDPRKTWLVTGGPLSLAGGVVSGAEIAVAPCFLPLVVVHLPLCLQGGCKWQPACSPLLFGHDPLILSVSIPGHSGALEPSHGKGLLSVFVSLAFPWFGLLCHISPLKVSLRHSTPVLTLRTDHVACTSASSLHLLPADRQECVSCFSACNCNLVQILSWFFFFYYASLWSSKIPYWPACERVS